MKFTNIFVFVLSLTSLSLTSAHAQGSRVKRVEYSPSANAIYFELGGPGILYTLNYDRMITEHFGVRAGIGGLGGLRWTDEQGTNDWGGSVLMIPVTAQYLFCSNDAGKLGSHKFELGGGIVYGRITANMFGSKFSGYDIGATATIGYRYQPTDGGFLFRAGFTPVVFSSTLIPYAGMSLGYAF